MQKQHILLGSPFPAFRNEEFKIIPFTIERETEIDESPPILPLLYDGEIEESFAPISNPVTESSHGQFHFSSTINPLTSSLQQQQNTNTHVEFIPSSKQLYPSLDSFLNNNDNTSNSSYQVPFSSSTSIPVSTSFTQPSIRTLRDAFSRVNIHEDNSESRQTEPLNSSGSSIFTQSERSLPSTSQNSYFI